MAYFDGLNEVILTAALISPKKGVFQSHIGFLLCLTTAVDITILGVSFTGQFTRDYCDLLEITVIYQRLLDWSQLFRSLY